MSWFKQKFNHVIGKTIIVLVVLVFAWLIFINQQAPVKAAAGINKQLSYQGKLTNSSGVAVADGTYNFKFVIYNASSGGTCLWTAVGACDTNKYGTTTATLVNGVFSVTLGGTGHNSLATSSVDWNTNSLYLGVTVRGTTASPVYDSEMSPRKQITAAAYAFNADTVDGLHATSSEAVANYLIALDARKVLNLWDGGVSSTKATTSAFVYIAPRQDYKTVDNLDRENGDLYVGGDAEFDGKVYFATSTFTQIPSQPHTFGAWAIGTANSNVADAALYINPPVAASDSNLLGLAVAGSVKLLVDAEGDIFANNLTLAGSQTLSTSTISTLVVENNSYLGDANNSDWTHIKGSVWIDSNKPGTAVSSTALVITQQGTGNYFEVSDGSLYYAGTRYFTITNAGVASTTKLFVQGQATSTNSLWLGSSGTANNIDLTSGDLYVSDDIEVDGEIFGSTARLSVLNASTTNFDSLSIFNELRAPTINATSTVFDHATVTDRIYVGNQFSVATSTPYPGYKLTVTGNSVFDGNLLIEKSSTTTDRLYVGSQLSVATSTPFPGYALTVKGNAVFSGQILVDSNIIFTTDAKGLLENTSDGADNNRLVLSGGGSSATNRGALIVLNGNEYGVIGQEGELLLAAGDNGNIVFGANNSIVNNSGTWGFNTTTPGGTTGEKFTFNGNTYFQGSATLTDRLYVGSQLSVATSTPFPGASLAVSGTNAAIEAVLYLKQLILTNSRVITAQGDGLVLERKDNTGLGFGQDFSGNFVRQEFFGTGVRIVDASSFASAETLNIPRGNLIVDGGATTTGYLWVGAAYTPPVNWTWGSGNLAVAGLANFAKSATISDSLYVGGFASSTTALNTQGTLHAGGIATIDSNTGIGTTTPNTLGAKLAVAVQSGYGIYVWNSGSGDSLFDDSGAKLTAAGTFTNAPSWSWYKENLTEPTDYLGKIRGLPIYEWQYKNEILDNNNRYLSDPYRHVSPFLDDFNKTFSVGPGNGINLQDWVGVALVGIKELDAKLDAKITELNNLLQQTQAQISVASQTNNAGPLPVIDNPAVDIKTLIVRDAAVFYGNLYVAGEAGFGVKVTFYNDVEIKGKLTVSKDQAGTAAMPAGATSTEVLFDQPYARTPVVVATLVDDAENEDDGFRPYKIASKSVNGFKIIMKKPMAREVSFDWIALAVNNNGENPPAVNNDLANQPPINNQETTNNNQPITNNEQPITNNEQLTENNTGGSGSTEQPSSEPQTQPTASDLPATESEIMPGAEISLDTTNQPIISLEVVDTPPPADQPVASEPAPAETPTASASNEAAASEPSSPAPEPAATVEASTN